MRYGMRMLSCVTAAVVLGLHGNVHAESLFIDYSIKPKLAQLTAPALCIVDPHAKADLKTAHERGHRVLAYISVVELAKGSPTADAAKKQGVPFVGTNAEWNSHVLDILDDSWAKYIVDESAAKAAAMGFDGFFLDTLDSLERVAGKDARRLEPCKAAIVQVVKALRQRWPRSRIIVNRGFDLLPRLQPYIDGLLVESVYQGFDPATKRYRATDAAGVTWIENHIRAAQKLHLPVYAVDYVSPLQRPLARATARRLKALGCVPLITTHDLAGEVLAP